VIAGGGVQGGAVPAASTSVAPSRPAPPPAAAPAPPGVSGSQAHVALETAVPREKIYFGHYEVQPMSPMRQRIAEHMVASKRVSAHVYSVDEIGHDPKSRRCGRSPRTNSKSATRRS